MLIWSFCGAAAAQALIDPVTAHKLEESLSTKSPQVTPLNCEWSRTGPGLSYGLQFQFGYVAEAPVSQFPGKGHELWALLQVTPRDGETNTASFFLRHYGLPPILATEYSAKFDGVLQAGEGAYDVAATLFDEQRRSCRAEWQIHVSPTREERAAITGMPPHTAAAVAGSTRPVTNRPTTTGGRLSILVHATSVYPDQSVLSESDIRMLTGALRAIVEELPARDVRLVLFSLAGQGEFYRRNGFRPQDIDHVRDVLASIGPGTVDVSGLLPARSADIMADLLNRELTAAATPDLIIFLGPPGRSNDRSSRKVRAKQKLAPPIFYIECANRMQDGPTEESGSDYESVSPPRVVYTDGRVMNSSASTGHMPNIGSRPQPRIGANSNEFNTLRHTVGALNGKTFVVWRPLDLAQSLQKIVSAVHKHSR